MSAVTELAQISDLPEQLVQAALAYHKCANVDEAANLLLDLSRSLQPLTPAVLVDALSNLPPSGYDAEFEEALKLLAQEYPNAAVPPAPSRTTSRVRRVPDATVDAYERLSSSDSDSACPLRPPQPRPSGMSYAYYLLRSVFTSTSVEPTAPPRQWEFVSPIERVAFFNVKSREAAEAAYVIIECTSRLRPIGAWAKDEMGVGTCAGLSHMQRGEVRCSPYGTSSAKWHPILCCTEGCTSESLRGIYDKIARLLIEVGARSVAVRCLGLRSVPLRAAACALAHFCLSVSVHVAVIDRLANVSDVHQVLSELVKHTSAPAPPAEVEAAEVNGPTQGGQHPMPHFSETRPAVGRTGRPLPSYVFSEKQRRLSAGNAQPLPSFAFAETRTELRVDPQRALPSFTFSCA